jgi:hypothetical protein
MRIFLFCLAAVSFDAAIAAAQAPLSPAPSVLFSAGAGGQLGAHHRWAAADTVRRRIRPTYWREGALVGGAVGALGGLLIARFICEQSEDWSRGCTGTTLAAVVATAVLLAVPGGLVGGQFSRPDSTRPSQAMEVPPGSP